MMKKKIMILVLSIFSLGTISNSFSFDAKDLTFSENSKKDNVISNFNKNYRLTYSISSDNQELEEEIKTLTKKTTYLLLGGFNNINESSEDYYKRRKDWFDLRYNPEIPKVPVDEANPYGLDTSSQEYTDDLISGLAIPQIFNKANESGIIYNSYGNIRISFNDDIIISSIYLPNVKIKEQDKSDPMKYNYIETNYIWHYYYKKLKDEWKLYYLYGETTDEVDNYFDQMESSEEKGTFAIAPSYESELSNIYSFEKLEKISQDEINNIYNQNISNVVYFNSYYNNMVVSSANGFFINKGLIVTTWDFIEKSLIEAQYITAKDSNLNSLEITGIVTANPLTDIAVIKVKDNSNSIVKLGNFENVNVEDPVITISSKSGTGASIQTGIIISNDDYIQTSIPLLNQDEGSLLLNQNSEVVGINTSKSTNSSVSIAVNSNVLMEIQNKFIDLDFDKIESISFEELKEKFYYTKYGDENIINNIPKNKWKKYSKIGNIEETLKLNLVKASYKDGIVSLRYKNDISKYISSMNLAGEFKEQLEKEGYKKITDNNSKTIYSNKKYQIVIMDEFDYLIIVMVKL